MGNAGRIGVIAVIAVVAFGAAFLLTGGDDAATDDPETDVAAGGADPTTTTTTAGRGTDPCRVSDPVPIEETPYEVTVSSEPDPPSPRGTTFEVLVQRDGAPLEDATVCISADMSQMSHEGVRAEAEEIGDGRYEVAVDFSMRGGWNGRLLVIEPGQPAAAMPMTFDVQ